MKTQIQFSEWGLIAGLAFLFALFFIQWRFKKKKQSSAVFYSDLASMEGIEESWRIRLIFLPSVLKKIAFVCFALALMHPVIKWPMSKNPKPSSKNNQELERQTEDKVHMPTEGIAIYFVLDQSGSMQAEMGYLKGHPESNRVLSRLEVLKYLTSQFIGGADQFGLEGRKNDLIGLVSFARVPKVLVPLTLDHDLIQSELKKLMTAKTIQEDGTAIGYAIYKTAHLIAATEHFSKDLLKEEKPAYEIKNTVMILVTDGIQNPNHLDMDHSLRSMSVKKAAKYAQEKGIRLYIVNIEPALAYAQYQQEFVELKQSAESTGGQFFLVSNVQNLQKIYHVIDQVEKLKQKDPRARSMVVDEKVKQKDPTFQYFELFAGLMKLGLVCLALSLILETTWLRKVP